MDSSMIYDIKRKMLTKYPRFGSEIAKANIEFKDDLPFHTAATDGQNIYIDPNYFASLSESDRLFTIAHEIMHIKFMHTFRLKDKEGKLRDLELWNIATDAIINANLERDGFKIKEGHVNMPKAIQYSAEEFYQILLQEKEKKKQEQQQSQNGNERKQDGENKDNSSNGMNQDQDSKSNENSEKQEEQQGQNGDEQKRDGENKDNSSNGMNQDQNSKSNENSEKHEQQQGQNGDEQKRDVENKDNSSNEMNQDQDGKSKENSENEENKQTSRYGDDHSLWEEAFKNKEQNKKQGGKKQKTQGDSKEEQASVEEQDMEIDEKNEFTKNREEKREKFKARRKKTEQYIRGETSEAAIKLDNIGESKEEIDWKILIRREVEKAETIWSQRRSIAENNYAYRLQENDIEDDAETEIMIDVSGSVDLELVKSFLRQIKPLLKQSKLRVGCFDVNFFDFIDIKNMKDIDNFTIPKGAGGCTDLDLPVRCFTKKREINKIVFTDGYPSSGKMPKDDLKKENIIWLVYGNKNFNPCCGKVINITERQLEKLHLINTATEDITR